MSSAGCAVCGRPQVEAYRPFCSKRCANVDLQRWLVGAYVIPEDEGEGEGPPRLGEDSGGED